MERLNQQNSLYHGVLIVPGTPLNYTELDVVSETYDDVQPVTPLWLANKLREWLPMGVSKFGYKDAKGEYQMATGTTHPALVPDRLAECGKEALDLLRDMDLADDNGIEIGTQFIKRLRDLLQKQAAYVNAPEEKIMPGLISYYDLVNFKWQTVHQDSIVAIF